jgi:hypothetical protein
VGLAAFSLAFVPFSKPAPIYVQTAEELLRGQKTPSDFWPVGYTGFLFVFLKIGGLAGLFVGQAIAYGGIIILAYAILRFLRVGRKAAFVGTTLVMLHPYLWINIKRIVDNNLAVLLMLGFVLFLLKIRLEGIGRLGAALFGVLCGWMVLVRANDILLLPLAVFLLAFHKSRRGPTQLWPGLLALIAGLATIVVTAVVITGQFYILPSNGGYNFFAGANDFSRDALLAKYNAEGSIGPALVHYGISADSPRSYWRLGMQYVRSRPMDYLFLALLKLLTLFRPDYRQLYTSGIASPWVLVVVQTLLATPVLIWLSIRWHFRNVKMAIGALPICLLAILYVTPFLLTNADPRFRLPLDIVLVLDATYCWNAGRSTGESLSSFKGLKTRADALRSARGSSG